MEEALAGEGSPQHPARVQRALDEADAEEGRTALLWAAQRGNADVVGILLSAGASKHRVDVEGKTAVFIAAWYGRHAALDILLRADCSHGRSSSTGYTPLHAAVYNHDIDSVRAVAAAKPDSLCMVDNCARTPQEFAANRCRTDAANQEQYRAVENALQALWVDHRNSIVAQRQLKAGAPGAGDDEVDTLVHVFERYDADGNHILDRDEIQAALVDLGFGHGADRSGVADRLLKEMDASEDGFVQLDEWLDNMNAEDRKEIVSRYSQHHARRPSRVSVVPSP